MFSDKKISEIDFQRSHNRKMRPKVKSTQAHFRKNKLRPRIFLRRSVRLWSTFTLAESHLMCELNVRHHELDIGELDYHLMVQGEARDNISTSKLLRAVKQNISEPDGHHSIQLLA